MKDSIKDKFNKYRFDLVVICTNGRTYLRLWKKVFKYFAENKELFQLSPTFFAFARDGLLESAVSNLVKLYDVHKDALSIYKYLNLAEQSRNVLFEKANQKELKNAIKQDRDKLSREEEVLSNLRMWRDKRLFHLDKNYAGDLNEVFREYILTIEQFENLFSLAKDILNRYSVYFDGVFNYMEYGMVDVHLQNFINQLTAEKKRNY